MRTERRECLRREWRFALSIRRVHASRTGNPENIHVHVSRWKRSDETRRAFVVVVYSGFKGVSVTKAAADAAIITATAAVTTPTVPRVIYIARNRVRAPLR